MKEVVVSFGDKVLHTNQLWTLNVEAAFERNISTFLRPKSHTLQHTSKEKFKESPYFFKSTFKLSLAKTKRSLVFPSS